MRERRALILHSGAIGWAAVRAALQERDDVSIIGEAKTHNSALFYASTHRIDLLLASDRLAEGVSYSTLAELRASSCRTSLIGLFTNGVEPDELEVFAQLELAGCFRWDALTSIESISAAIEALLVGNLLMGTRKVVRDYFYISRGTNRETHHAIELSDLDRQILALLAQGLTDKKIGPLVNRAPKTVGHRLDDLRDRLGARNRPHLVHLAHQLSYIRQLNAESPI